MYEPKKSFNHLILGVYIRQDNCHLFFSWYITWLNQNGKSWISKFLNNSIIDFHCTSTHKILLILGDVSLWFFGAFFRIAVLISSELFERSWKSSRTLPWFRALYNSSCPRRAQPCFKRYRIASSDACKRVRYSIWVRSDCRNNDVWMLFSVLTNAQPFSCVVVCTICTSNMNFNFVTALPNPSVVKLSPPLWGLKR